MHKEAENHCYLKLKPLWKSGADVNAINDRGETALMLAIRSIPVRLKTYLLPHLMLDKKHLCKWKMTILLLNLY